MSHRAPAAFLAVLALAVASGCGGGTAATAKRAEEPRLDIEAKPAPPRVLVLGDSNLHESEMAVDDALESLSLTSTIHGVPSFGLKDLDYYWLPELGRLLRPVPALVVVALGTNDAVGDDDVRLFPSRLDTLMGALGDRPVVWVTHVARRPDGVPDGGQVVNAAILAAPARWPNLTVLDLTPVLSADPSLLRADELHFSDTGRVVYAERIAAAAAARLAATSWGAGG